jgi:UDP-N-acetylglucosamine 2-epimerase
VRRVLCIIGTRPEAIKMAPVVQALRSPAGVFEPLVCATAQHRGLLDQVLDLFDLEPDFDLNLMRPDQGLCDLMSAAMAALGELLTRVKPDLVIVQGDTTSSLAGALAGFYQRVQVAHVEAGLRTGDRAQPFPEEVNRHLTDKLSDWLFAPTEAARAHLLREGFPSDRIVVTGNTVIDTLVHVRRELSRADWRSRMDRFARDHAIGEKRLVLVTCHRRESFGQPIAEICSALRTIAARPDVQVVYPAHPNPNVQRAIAEHLHGSGVRVTNPLDYAVFVWLLSQASLILTDSGGIQEEATFLGIPTLVLRNTTERPEAVDAGVAKIIGTAEERIVSTATRLLDNPDARAEMSRPSTIFGDGRASERIATALRDALS